MKNKHKKIIIILLLTISITTGSLYIWQAVAAFEHGTTDKKIKEMIENFVQVIGKNNPSYKLVIAGNTNTGKQDYFHELKQIESINNNIEIKNDISYAELLCLYKSAKIFWHAAGYGVDEKKESSINRAFWNDNG